MDDVYLLLAGAFIGAIPTAYFCLERHTKLIQNLNKELIEAKKKQNNSEQAKKFKATPDCHFIILDNDYENITYFAKKSCWDCRYHEISSTDGTVMCRFFKTANPGFQSDGVTCRAARNSRCLCSKKARFFAAKNEMPSDT